MTRTLITLLLSACTIAVTAKTNTVKTATVGDSITRLHKPFANVELQFADDEMTLNRLPLHAVSMYILDEQGNVAASYTVSRKHNKVNVRQLQPGLYTIVLKQGDKIGIYGYHTDVVIKAHRANS